jgi:hypothetical protein
MDPDSDAARKMIGLLRYADADLDADSTYQAMSEAIGAGTRVLFYLEVLGRDESDPLFLQVKEAEESVLSRFLGASEFANMGQRVVAGQWLMQASSDIFLGWHRVAAGLDGKQRDFYVRQLRDWKFSLDVDAMVPGGMRMYGALCG